jgi:catechol 2,3-dioxygenase-like lactoylglutathione lyase family enzyme
VFLTRFISGGEEYAGEDLITMDPLKLRSVMLMVGDLAKSERFYQEVLGLKVEGRVEKEFVFFNAGGDVQLVIREGSGVGVGSVNPGHTEFVFEVPDIMKAYQELLSKGVAFTKPPRAVTSGASRDLFATDFRDPDGHVLSITGWVQKK